MPINFLFVAEHCGLGCPVLRPRAATAVSTLADSHKNASLPFCLSKIEGQNKPIGVSGNFKSSGNAPAYPGLHAC